MRISHEWMSRRSSRSVVFLTISAGVSLLIGAISYARFHGDVPISLDREFVSQEPTSISLPAFEYIQALSTTAWVGVDGVSISTTFDGGRTWQTSFRLENKEKGKYSAGLSFVDERTGFVFLDSSLLRSDDQGRSWRKVSSPNFAIRSIEFRDGLTGWAVGSRPVKQGAQDKFRGSIWKTTDGGITWLATYGCSPKNDSDFDWEFTDVSLVADAKDDVWVSGTSLLCHSTDGGETWKIVEVDGSRWSTARFVSKKLGWVGNENGVFAFTRDGGKTWTDSRVPIKFSNADSSLYLLGEKRGYFLNWSGQLFVSDDFQEWTYVPSNDSEWQRLQSRSHGGKTFASVASDGSLLLIWLSYENGSPSGLRSIIIGPEVPRT